MRRGPKETPKIEYARAAYWGCNLSYISGQSFTKLERLLTPWAVKKRDGGGFIQPYAFKKYATGQRIPESEGDQSPINRAEKYFPGSIAIYNSILWDIVGIEAENRCQVDLKDIYRRANPEVINYLKNDFLLDKSKPVLNELGKFEVRLLKHIDAFALLLLTIRLSETITIQDIHNLQSWLLFNVRQAPFSMCSELLLSIFEEAIPEVGIMTGPLGYISNRQNRPTNSVVTALTSGRVVTMEFGGGFFDKI